MNGESVVPINKIESIILIIRRKKVILDRDLAELYGVTTGNLNKAVKRNIDRFPDDFMFQLTKEEYEAVRFQFGIFETGRHSKYLPNAFTEQGVAMRSSVLRSRRAVTTRDRRSLVTENSNLFGGNATISKSAK